MKIRILVYWISALVLAVMFGCAGDEVSPRAVPSDNTIAEIPMTITIVTGITDLEIYSDPELTLPATSVDWPDAPRGAEVRNELYIRNTGTTTVFIHQRVVEDISSWTDHSFAPLHGAELMPDRHGTWMLRLFINPDAPVGEKGFTLELYEATP